MPLSLSGDRVARLFKQKGWTGKAIENNEKFLILL